jgi:acetyl/propionyl-CoA carboxylase alpha subunit
MLPTFDSSRSSEHNRAHQSLGNQQVNNLLTFRPFVQLLRRKQRYRYQRFSTSVWDNERYKDRILVPAHAHDSRTARSSTQCLAIRMLNRLTMRSDEFMSSAR